MSLIEFLLGIPAIMLATTIHEFTRAAVSTALGDKLPKEEGRLTMNPFNHFEPIGMLLMLANGFGWGRPVNTSSLYYKDRKKGVLITAIAPTAANLVFAVIAAFLVKVFENNYWLGIFFIQLSHYNFCLLVYNLLPVSPMDCVKVLSVSISANSYFKLMQYEKVIQMIFLFVLFLGAGGFFETIAYWLFYAVYSVFI